MVIGSALAAALLLVLIWLLWAPIRFDIDTRQGIYCIRWRSIGALNWLPEQQLDMIEIEIFFWKKRIALLEQPSGRPKKIKPKTAKNNKLNKTRWKRISWSTVKRMARTFEVHYCRLSLDTGDYVWNAWLFPVCWFVRSPRYSVWINFIGENELALRVENRLGRILWAFISSQFK